MPKVANRTVPTFQGFRCSMSQFVLRQPVDTEKKCVFEGHILLHRVHKLLFHGIQCTTNHHIAVLLGAQNLSHNVFKGAYVLLRWAKSHSVVSFLALAWKAGLVLAHCMHLSCAHKLIKQWKGIHRNLHADESACVWDHSFPYNILI